ncbi:MAG: ABC transporter substrate-binding protein [Chloroflexi bacterium]|nr:ABC transporter substrate-binding protein [Chloroflexota bacterium]
MNNKQQFTRFFSLMIILLMTIVLFGGTHTNVIAQDERVLVIGHAESTDSLDPARGYTQTTGIVNRATYSTLVTFPDEDASRIDPMLATDWEISADGLVYTFNLRDDVAFTNGDSISADDVVFSVQRLKNVTGNPAFLADNIASVEAIDDFTVQFTLNTARPSFLAELTNYAFSITNADQIRENGGTDAEDAAETDEAEAFLNNNSAGTGPYILERWEPQVETVLVRNPDYWGEAPYFDRVIIANIPEAATQKIALESGEIDMALDLTGDQVMSMANDPSIGIFRGPSQYTHFLLMNQDPEIGGVVSDPTVQLAIRYALDYEGYKILWGGVTPGSNMAFGLAGSYGEDQAFSRDLDRARELLAEAGYPDGFEITLSYPDFTWQGVNMNTNAQKIQSDLAEVGIDVSLNPGELQVSLEEYRNGQQGFGYWFWGPDILDPLDLLSFLPGGIVGDRANWSPETADQELLDLIAMAEIETDSEVRLDLFAQLQDYLQQSGPFAPFNQPDVQTAYRADIQGYVFHPQWTMDVSILSRAE